MNIEDIPFTLLHAYQLLQPNTPSPSGSPAQAVDLVLQTSPGPEGPLQAIRFRLSYQGVESLARSFAEVPERNPDRPNQVHRVLTGAKMSPVQVETVQGSRAVFLLTLEQVNIAGAVQLPVDIVLEPETVVSMAEMFRSTLAHHDMFRAIAPSTATPQ